MRTAFFTTDDEKPVFPFTVFGEDSLFVFLKIDILISYKVHKVHKVYKVDAPVFTLRTL